MELDTICMNCLEDKGSEDACPFCGYQAELVDDSGQHLAQGTLLKEKYVVAKVLGQGGFGITYLALDTTLNLKLAVKEYLPQQIANRTTGNKSITVFQKTLSDEFKYGLKKFLDEARTLARFVEHPSFVSVRDYFEENDTAYMVMNYVEGVTLQKYIENKGGKISVEEALPIFLPVFDALSEIHSSDILHRDISPDNLLINKKGQVVLIDFGAARQAMNQYSKGLSVILKAGYSPEEQYRSKGQQGPWTDIYALAATFYRAITGWMPPESLDRLAEDKMIIPSDLGVDILPHQEEALMKALSVKAGDRYQTVEDFQKALYAKPDAKQIATQRKEVSAPQSGAAATMAASPYDSYPPQPEVAVPPREMPPAAAKPAVPPSKGMPMAVKVAVGFLSLIVVASLALFMIQANNDSTTGSAVLEAPKLISPIDRANYASQEIVFRWNKVDGADHYWLTIVKLPQNTVVFDDKVGNVTEITRRNFPGDGSEYRWRVAAGNDDGLGRWSTYATFINGVATVTTTAPPATTVAPTTTPRPTTTTTTRTTRTTPTTGEFRMN